MPTDRSIATQEELLRRLPADFAALAEWGWGALRGSLDEACRQLGMDPVAAARTASRVARLVVTQVYEDVRDYRRLQAAARNVLILALALGAPAIAAAQDPPPVTTAHQLAWSQEAPSLARAQAYQYWLVVDGARRTEPQFPIVCTGDVAPYTCSTPFPALTPGEHALRLVAAELVAGVLLESSPSDELRVTMVVISPPRNLRVVVPGGQP